MHLHQDINVELVGALPGSKEGSAQLWAADIAADRLDDANSLFNELAGLGKVAAFLFHARNTQQGCSLTDAVTYRPSDRQGFVVLLQRLLRISQRLICPADVVESGSHPAAVTYRLPDRK